MKTFSLLLIRLYQKFLAGGLNLGGACRFAPSCSEYTYQAIEKYGALAGWNMGLRRLVRCHPFSLGGWDPVR